jgi:hypothetical protein
MVSYLKTVEEDFVESYHDALPNMNIEITLVLEFAIRKKAKEQVDGEYRCYPQRVPQPAYMMRNGPVEHSMPPDVLREVTLFLQQAEERVYQAALKMLASWNATVMSAETAARPVVAPPEKRSARRRQAHVLTERERVIRKAIRNGKTGLHYAEFLDSHSLDTPEEWQNNKHNPCPKKHVMGYKDLYYRDLMHKEKSRVKGRMKQTKN